MHIMIDLETWGTRPDAAISQVGAVAFEPRSGGRVYDRSDQTFNEYVLMQDGAGSVDHATVAWWLTQSAEAQGRLSSGMQKRARPLHDVLTALAEWPERCLDASWETIDGVWCHGLAFDVPVLCSAYAKCGRVPPWSYRAGRDTRTLFDLAGGAPEVDSTGFVGHDALDDAMRQAMQVQAALALLGQRR